MMLPIELTVWFLHMKLSTIPHCTSPISLSCQSLWDVFQCTFFPLKNSFRWHFEKGHKLNSFLLLLCLSISVLVCMYLLYLPSVHMNSITWCLFHTSIWPWSICGSHLSLLLLSLHLEFMLAITPRQKATFRHTSWINAQLQVGVSDDDLILLKK